MTFDVHRIAVLVGAATAVAALGLTAPGSAAADPGEDAYLHQLLSEGVLFAGRPKVLERARTVCEAFDAGMSPAAVRHKIHRDAEVFTARQTAVFVAITEQSYCPTYATAERLS